MTLADKIALLEEMHQHEHRMAEILKGVNEALRETSLMEACTLRSVINILTDDDYAEKMKEIYNR